MTLFRCDKGAETEYTSNKIALKKPLLFCNHTNMHIPLLPVLKLDSKANGKAAGKAMFTSKSQLCSILDPFRGEAGRVETPMDPRPFFDRTLATFWPLPNPASSLQFRPSQFGGPGATV